MALASSTTLTHTHTHTPLSSQPHPSTSTTTTPSPRPTCFAPWRTTSTPSNGKGKEKGKGKDKMNHLDGGSTVLVRAASNDSIQSCEPDPDSEHASISHIKSPRDRDIQPCICCCSPDDIPDPLQRALLLEEQQPTTLSLPPLQHDDEDDPLQESFLSTSSDESSSPSTFSSSRPPLFDDDDDDDEDNEEWAASTLSSSSFPATPRSPLSPTSLRGKSFVTTIATEHPLHHSSPDTQLDILPLVLDSFGKNLVPPLPSPSAWPRHTNPRHASSSDDEARGPPHAATTEPAVPRRTSLFEGPPAVDNFTTSSTTTPTPSFSSSYSTANSAKEALLTAMSPSSLPKSTSSLLTKSLRSFAQLPNINLSLPPLPPLLSLPSVKLPTVPLMGYDIEGLGSLDESPWDWRPPPSRRGGGGGWTPSGPRTPLGPAAAETAPNSKRQPKRRSSVEEGDEGSVSVAEFLGGTPPVVVVKDSSSHRRVGAVLSNSPDLVMPGRVLSSPHDQDQSGSVQLQTFSRPTPNPTPTPSPPSTPRKRTIDLPELPTPPPPPTTAPMPRLISNQRHLLMLSLELSMIQSGKINCPLRQRQVVFRQPSPPPPSLLDVAAAGGGGTGNHAFRKQSSALRWEVEPRTSGSRSRKSKDRLRA
ncbi:hypothetical protein T439DRAFT_320638 [Meredithblackwellia eburnea MCA 4105]